MERFYSIWWVFAFIFVCYTLYEQAVYKWEGEYSVLKKQMELLKEKKMVALVQQEDLLLQINSQSDPEWVELTLMRGLGLVPEGQKKIYFSDN